MKRPLLAAVAGMAVLGTTVGAYVVASPGGEEEVVQQAATATPDSTASMAPSPATPIATFVPTATPPGIQEDWKTYSDPGGLFTVRYPPDWFQMDSSFSSYDPRSWSGHGIAPDSVEVEIGYYPVLGSTVCGALSVDSKTGEGAPQAGATATSLGGFPAWQLVRGPGDPAIEGGLTRIQGISAIHNGYCFLVTAYYSESDPDIDNFVEISNSFEFDF